jgi:hypothetical protein
MVSVLIYVHFFQGPLGIHVSTKEKVDEDCILQLLLALKSLTVWNQPSFLSTLW